jgi:NADH dehydrogenase (ubiquinone) Fe-S protein 1
MFNIRINNNICTVSNTELTILQQCELNSIYIPRFCYHDRLSIAGNCRMCLIELETSVKPIIACSTSLVPNMSVYTNSKTVKKIRENILEFLLINHPLDCPICDQGGECDLQDQAMVFGSDRGRFIEIKRSVEDKDFGPFIKTVMTRCIHCTRCVRFFDEVAGTSILGMMGRGRDAEISTYSNLHLINELSGNVIDLCPVGALTSKPYAFTSRPWELVSYESIDIFDSLGSNIRIDIKGNLIMRILPKLNEEINEEWITDQIRFSYDGFRRDRLTFPLIKTIKNKNMLFTYGSWDIVFSKIKYLFSNASLNFKVYSGELLDLFSLYLFRYWMDTCNVYLSFFCENSLHVNNSSSFLLSSGITDLHQFNSILFINTNLKQDISVLNVRIKKIKWKLKEMYNIYYIGINTVFNYKVKHLGLSISTLISIIRGKHFVCSSYLSTSLCTMHNGAINEVINNLRTYVPSSICNSVSIHTSDIHYNLLGFKKNDTNLTINSDMCVYYLLNYDKNILMDASLINYIIYQGHHGNWNAMHANIVLPMLSYTEIRGFYMNLEGRIQISEQIIYGPGISKSCVDIFLNIITKPYQMDTLSIKYLNYIFNVFISTNNYHGKLNVFNLSIAHRFCVSNVLFNSSRDTFKNSIVMNSLIFNKSIHLVKHTIFK